MLLGRGPQLSVAKGYADFIIADNPLHYARYDDTTGLTTTATVGSDVTHTDSTTITLNSKSLLASEPSQASYYSISNAARVDYSALTGGGVVITSGSGGWTVDFWMEYDSTTAAYQVFLLDTSLPVLYLHGGNLVYWDTSGKVDPQSLSISTTYYIAYVYDGNTSVKTYINGALSATLTTTTASSQNPTWKYALHNGVSEGLFGYIQEMAIYNTALTSSQILAHYNAGV